MPVIAFAPTDPCETMFQKFFTLFKSKIPGLRPVMDQPSSINPSVTITPGMPGAILPASHSTTKSPLSYIVTKTDADVYQVVDAETLEPLAKSTFGDMHPLLKGGALTGAHSCQDPVTGDFYNYVTKFGAAMSYNVFRIRGQGPDRGKVDVLAQITDAPIAYMHSTCMTEKYFILCVWQADIMG
jgi:torulene dioxygenase